jgi:hypothetical protein
MKSRDQVLLEEAYQSILLNKERSQMLSENPEFIADTYLRDKYDYELFIGDAHGAVLVFNKPGVIQSHIDVLRQLVKKNSLDKKTYELLEINDPNFEIVGSPIALDTNYSGVILPKQKDVDGTYVSFWTERSYNRMKLFLADYVLKHYDGPHYYEYTDLDDPSERTTIVPIRKRQYVN